MDTTNLIENLQRALRFDASFYREVANDERYNQQALTVVILAAVLSGVGAFLGSLFSGAILGAFLGLLLGVVVTVIGYYVWAYVVQFVGAQFFQGQATAPQLFRTLGYAYAPTALNMLSFIPCVGGLVALVGSVWALVCGFFAVREAHRLDDGKTLLTVIIGWILVAIITAILGVFGALFGAGAVGFGSLLRN